MTQERFEHELRAVLAELTTAATPPGLSELLARLPESEPVGRGSVRARLLGGTSRRTEGPLVAIAAAAVVAVLVGALVVLLTASGGLSASRSGRGAGAAQPALDWDSGVVSLTAQSVALQVDGQPFLAAPEGLTVRSDAGDSRYQTLEVTWRERGREMRLNIYFAADESHWWASELRTYDGADRPDWLSYAGPLFRTPLGQPFTGDVDLASVDGRGRFTLTGLRIDAFTPGRVRTGPTGCRAVVPAADSYSVGPLGEGQPLAGSGLDRMTPSGAAAWLGDRGWCVTWRFQYFYTDNAGYSEFWCTPPEGVISDLSYDGKGNLVIFVSPPKGSIRTPRPQPALGWGC